MRNWYRRLQRKLRVGLGRHHGTSCHKASCENLAQAVTDSTVTITCNNDHKTVERGLYTGVQVKILRNEMNEPNLIVAVGDARYVLDRRIAKRIKVCAD